MRSWLGSAVALGALWVCIEWLRAHFLCLGFSWNSLGSALYGGYAFAQWAEFIGTNGLSIIPASFSILLWGALRRAYLHQRGAGRINRPWDFYGAVVLLMLLYIANGFHVQHKHSELDRLTDELKQKIEDCAQITSLRFESGPDSNPNTAATAEENPPAAAPSSDADQNPNTGAV